MLNKLILFPFGGNAREALCVVDAINAIQPTWEVIGFIDDNPQVLGQEFCGLKVLGGRELLDEFKDAFCCALPGNADNFGQRPMIIESLELDRSRLVTIIHPQAVITKGCQIGVNTLICAHVVCGAGTIVSDHCILLPNTTISHDSQLGDYSCVGSNVAIAGGVKIENSCYIGSGSQIINDVTIHSNSLIGMGSNVITDVAASSVVCGNPAKVLRKA